MAPTLPAESEAAFQQKVINLAIYNGWRCYHPPDNRPLQARSGRRYVQSVAPGYPDLTLARARDGRLIFAELKAEKGRTSTAQEEWLAILRSVAEKINGPSGVVAEFGGGIEVYVWRPSDFETIEAVLRRERW
jgi:hypothetical protein